MTDTQKSELMDLLNTIPRSRKFNAILITDQKTTVISDETPLSEPQTKQENV